MNTAASIENKNYCKYVLFLIDAARLQKQTIFCTYPMQTVPVYFDSQLWYKTLRSSNISGQE
jgi:hypothetical protein